MNDITRRYALPVTISLSFFAGLLFGFPHGKAPVRLVEAVPPTDDRRIVISPIVPDESDDIVDAKTAAKESPALPRLPDIVSSEPVVSSDIFVPFEPILPPYEGPSITSIPFEAGVHGSISGGSPIATIAQLSNHPRATFQPAPQYPYDMKQAGIDGTVTVEFVVETDGKVSSVRVVSSTHQSFEEPALQAMRHWRFESGMSGGKKVRFRMAQPLTFKLSR